MPYTAADQHGGILRNVIIGALAVSALAACKKTGEGEYQVKTPDVDVSTDTHTVKTPSVDVVKDTATVKVPEVKTETKKVEVPKVRVKTP